MLKRLILPVATLALAACEPPPPVPPPRFTPNPPYAPDIVPPDDQPMNPDARYGYTEPDPRDEYANPDAGTRPDYPTATRTGNPNEVVSPYPPHKVIDVSDFSSGQLARDPWNEKIFRVP